MTRAEGDLVFFTLDRLGADDTCEVTAEIQIARDGVLDPSFARDFVMPDISTPAPTRFDARQWRSAKTHVTPQ